MDIQEALARCNKHIDSALASAGSGFNAVTSYLSQSKGKGVRSLLLLTAAADLEGNVHEDACLAAAAIELLHMATLVHDDVMDDAPTRRGIPSLHKKFDVKTAVICGDYLLSLSLSMLADMDKQRTEKIKEYVPLIPKLSRALSSVCKGEYGQHVNNGNLDMSLLTYLRIISGKTAALFFISAYAGAMLSDAASADEAMAIGRYGRCLGMIFQIADDCKDYEWTEEMAMKPVGNDIKTGVITLPLIFALRKNPALKSIAKEVLTGQRSHAHFVQALRGTDGLEAAREVSARYAAWGEQALRGIDAKKKAALLHILYGIKGV